MIIKLEQILCDRCGLHLDLVIIESEVGSMSGTELFHRHCWRAKQEEMEVAAVHDARKKSGEV